MIGLIQMLKIKIRRVIYNFRCPDGTPREAVHKLKYTK